MFGAAAALYERRGFQPQPSDQHEFDRFEAELRARLDDITLARWWAKGGAMTTEEAIAFALEDPEA